MFTSFNNTTLNNVKEIDKAHIKNKTNRYRQSNLFTLNISLILVKIDRIIIPGKIHKRNSLLSTNHCVITNDIH